MAEAVYLLCAATSIICAALLMRQYRSSRNQLLLWSGGCFIGLACNNVLLVIDLIVIPSVSLEVWRGLSVLVSLTLLLVGLIWDAD